MSEKENKEKEIKVEGAKKETENLENEANNAENEAENAENTVEEKEEKEPLEEANEQIAKLKDTLLRTMAEFDNYKKRTLKEKTELILNGGEKTISAILPVIDDMERAMANADKADDIKKLEEGWELIFKKFVDTLATLGVKKIETEDADFDTDFHEAIAMVPGMGDDKKGKVIDCVQSGYMLNEKVIRHAKVAVGQ